MTEEEMWVQFACSAIAGHEVPEDFEGDTEELANDIADVAEAVADVMVEAYKERFIERPTTRRGLRRGSKGRSGRGGGGEEQASKD